MDPSWPHCWVRAGHLENWTFVLPEARRQLGDMVVGYNFLFTCPKNSRSSSSFIRMSSKLGESIVRLRVSKDGFYRIKNQFPVSRTFPNKRRQTIPVLVPHHFPLIFPHHFVIVVLHHFPHHFVCCCYRLSGLPTPPMSSYSDRPPPMVPYMAPPVSQVPQRLGKPILENWSKYIKFVPSLSGHLPGSTTVGTFIPTRCIDHR